MSHFPEYNKNLKILAFLVKISYIKGLLSRLRIKGVFTLKAKFIIFINRKVLTHSQKEKWQEII